MCACEGTYVCPRCADTPADPAYAEWPEDTLQRWVEWLYQAGFRFDLPAEGHRSALDATGAA
jgi:hypothetical protein